MFVFGVMSLRKSILYHKKQARCSGKYQNNTEDMGAELWEKDRRYTGS